MIIKCDGCGEMASSGSTLEATFKIFWIFQKKYKTHFCKYCTYQFLIKWRDEEEK